MPGSGEFKIGTSVPLETRIGVSGKKGTFDIQITGPHFGLDAEVASQPVADQLFATKLGLMQKCIGIQWGAKGCRYGVCGYDGSFRTPPVFDPTYFGVGAYSEDGKEWTTFQALTSNGSIITIFHMRDPSDKTKNIVVVGGSQNIDPPSDSSTARLETVVGEGPDATGQTALGGGPNVAAFDGIGYDKVKQVLYGRESSGQVAGTEILHTFELGSPSTPSPAGATGPFWAGLSFDGLTVGQECSTDDTGSMTFEDKNSVTHTVKLVQNILIEVHLDGVDITPPGARNIFSAAGGTNKDGENIIVAVGQRLPNDESAAWWSIDGKSWTEITGIWPLNTSGIAQPSSTCAVPNS